MSISTHILDTAKGRPAAGVAVALDRDIDGEWETLNAATTDADGRIRHLLPEGEPMLPGLYCARFATGDYFKRDGQRSLYPVIEITFRVDAADPCESAAAAHYHVPLLIAANGYTTYRGT